MLSHRCVSRRSQSQFVLDDFGPGSTPKLIGHLGGPLNAWTRHVAYGTITRLRALTEPTLKLVLQGKITIASVLQRSILENAGRAAFAIGKLTECSKSGKWDDLRLLIPKTLFGTCMTDVEGSIFEELSELTAQRPAKVGQFIDALETLGGTAGGGQSVFDGLYSFLCDLAHASQRANQSYCRILESSEYGWRLQYTWEEATATPESVGGALNSTMRCLQCGYAACAMLLAWQFADSPDGLEWHAFSERDAEWVWSHVLDPALVFG